MNSALARAMWFKEKQGASVTVITVGNAGTEPSLRKALAIGADDAIRIDAEATDGFLCCQTTWRKLLKANGYDLGA